MAAFQNLEQVMRHDPAGLADPFRMLLVCQCLRCTAWRKRLSVSAAQAYKPTHGGYPSVPDRRPFSVRKGLRRMGEPPMTFELDLPWPPGLQFNFQRWRCAKCKMPSALRPGSALPCANPGCGSYQLERDDPAERRQYF